MSEQPLRRRWSHHQQTTATSPTVAKDRSYSSSRWRANSSKTDAAGSVYDADKSATTEEESVGSVGSMDLPRSLSLGVNENTRFAWTTATLETNGASPSADAPAPPQDDLPDPPQDDLPDPARRLPLDITQFRLLYLLDQGAFGQVHMAWHPSLRPGQSMVAVKECRKVRSNGVSLCEVSAYRELAVLQSLVGTAFFCQLLCAFHSQSMVYFIMEFARYGSLQRHVWSQGRLVQSEAVLYFAEITYAISVLHERSISHGDIKPANILIRKDGHSMLSDFGCANQFTNNDKSKHRLQFPRGTPGYMAPEMYTSRNPYDAYAADWFSAGATLYMMVTGHSPCKHPLHPRHRGNGRKSTAYEDAMSSLKRTNPHVFTVIQRLMAVRPRARLCSRYGISELKHERLFQDVQWDDVASKKLKMPSVEVGLNKVAQAQEFGFIDWNRDVSQLDSDRFRNFYYCSPWLLEQLNTKPAVRESSGDRTKEEEAIRSEIMAFKFAEEAVKMPRRFIHRPRRRRTRRSCTCVVCAVM